MCIGRFRTAALAICCGSNDRQVKCVSASTFEPRLRSAAGPIDQTERHQQRCDKRRNIFALSTR